MGFGEEPKMEVDLAVLADSANRSENGKLNILGIFDNFNIGPIFPAQTPSCPTY